MHATERRYINVFLAGLFFLLLWSAWDYGGRYLHVQAFSQVLCAGLVMLLALQLLRHKDFSPLLDYPLLKPALLLLLVLGMSWIFSVNRLASLEEIWRWVMYLLLALGTYGWLRLMPDPGRAVVQVATGSLLIGTGIVVLGFAMPSAESGLSSTFYRTNDLAGYLLLQVPLALHLLLTRPGRLAKGVYGLVFGVLAGALVLTNSRSSWVAGLLACGLVLVFNRRQLQQRALQIGLAVGGVALLAGLGLFWQKVLPRLETLLSMRILQENATSWRLELLEGAWQMFLAHPLLGTGPNTFASAFPAFQQQPGYYSINPHNFYLQALAETGLLGLIALGIWLLVFVRVLLRRPNACSLGILAGLAASLFHIGFDIDWSVSAIPILFAVLLGAGLAPAVAPLPFLAEGAETDAEAAPPDARPAGILIFVCLALALIPSLNYFS
ncbi:MAG TPA: O-antigen ligase family protein, partial [Candidatus Obscuribacterales bacterium]